MTEIAKGVLNKLLAMPDDELRKLIKAQSKKPQHWATGALEKAGYFKQLVKERRAKKNP